MLEKELIDSMIAEMSVSPAAAYFQLKQVNSLLESIAEQDTFANSNRQRENGVFYTDFDLAYIAISEVLKMSSNPKGSFLEPCVGGGAFYFAFIDLSMRNTSGTINDLKNILDRCYIADNDKIAIEVIQQVAPSYFKSRFGHALEIPTSNIFLGNSLWSSEENKIQDLRKTFNRLEGFDIVVTNPPYKLLKGDRRLGKNSSKHLIDIAIAIKSTNQLKFVQGVPNVYKLFVETIACQWVSDRGTIGLLVPRSLLTDSQSSKLREHLLDNFEFGPIYSIPEGADYFKGVGQAFSMFAASKGKPTTSVVFATGPQISQGDRINHGDIVMGDPINIDVVRQYSANSAIHEVNPEGQRLLKHLSKFPKISSFPGIVNLRGEFDMSLDISSLSETDTDFKLVQGSHIGHFNLKPSKISVSEAFLNRPKGKWIRQNRIACQQISNMNQKRRMKWSYIPVDKVLGNSCNFIGLELGGLWSPSEETIYYFLGLLNSTLINERFKLLSPNNHISNGEIGSLPMGDLSSPEIPKIIELSCRLSSTFQWADFEELDALVLLHFGLTKHDKYWERN